jgi:hypothetical protein
MTANPAIQKLVESLDHDLPRSALFREKVPALAEAFDAGRMTPALQEALLGSDQSQYSILKCVPGKALYLPNHIINMQYKLTILDNASSQEINTMVNARLFQDLDSCRKYLDQTLKPIAARMEGRPETEPFVRSVTLIEDLKITLSVFPIDGLIPTLVETTDPHKIASILAEVLPEASSGKFLIQDVHLLPAHYGRFARCVLRYSVDGLQTETQTPQNLTVYGKIDPDGSGEQNVAIVSALAEYLGKSEVPYRFRIPGSLGYFPELQLLLMEALPGEPFFKELLKTWSGHSESSLEKPNSHEKDERMEEAVRTCALIAATIHGSNIKLGSSRTLEVQVARLQQSAHVVSQVFPELGAQLESWIQQTVEFAQVYPALPLVFSHGDFTYTQLIFDGKAGGLVDFDTMGQAEPAQDLGHYLAYLRLNIIKGQDPNAPFAAEAIERLCALFLDTYIDVSRAWIPDEAVLRGRAAIYELISLMQLTLHSWEKMKGSRLKQTIRLLEERIECQKQISQSLKNKTA